MLHLLHALYPLTDEPIDVWEADTYKFVTATAKLQAETLMLPPCIPKQMKLVAVKSVHPLAAKIAVKEQSAAETPLHQESTPPLTPACTEREVITLFRAPGIHDAHSTTEDSRENRGYRCI